MMVNLLGVGGTAFVIAPPIRRYDGDLTISVRAEAVDEIATYAPVADRDALEDGFDSVLIAALNVAYGPDPDRGIPRRLSAMADIFVAHDAPIHHAYPSRLRAYRAERFADRSARLTAIHPALGLAAWTWDTVGDAPGLDDPAVRGWATSRAADQIGEPWAMRLLAALGAAA
jgi:hypothetical protein